MTNNNNNTVRVSLRALDGMNFSDYTKYIGTTKGTKNTNDNISMTMNTIPISYHTTGESIKYVNKRTFYTNKLISIKALTAHDRLNIRPFDSTSSAYLP